MNQLPWIVFIEIPDFFYRVVCRFGTRAEAEMHAQRLNHCTHSSKYKVCFEKSEMIAG